MTYQINSIPWRSACRSSGGFFDLAGRRNRLAELERLSQEEGLWSDPDRAKVVLRERSQHQETIDSFLALERLLEDARAAHELADEDAEFEEEVRECCHKLESQLAAREFLCKMRGEHDHFAAIVEINGGAGGTEAQDWAEMLLRMYLRWAERHGLQAEQIDYRPGEEAGIKSATVLVEGEYAYGYLRSEQGVHRLVRISPFDSNSRRHTSFASVAVTPDAEEEIDIEIDEKDLRIDTYRSSGAGGQHVNKTDSAVRITHLPSNIVVACQNERSQHKNKATALKVLKSKLYDLEMQEQQKKLDQLKGERKAIDFGSQIRSYVMHPYRMVKDLRTGFETSSVEEVLDGDIDSFIESYLMSDSNKAETVTRKE